MMLLRTIMLTTRSFLDERKTWQKKRISNMHMLSIVLLFIPVRGHNMPYNIIFKSAGLMRKMCTLL